MTFSRTSSLHLYAAVGSSSESSLESEASTAADSSSADSTSSASSLSSSSTSAPKYTPWKELIKSESTSPSPLISKEMLILSPFAITGTFHISRVFPSSVDSSILTSVLSSRFAPRTVTRSMSKPAGIMSLMLAS